MSAKGNFFLVDQPVWHAACDLGVNAAVAYLVLARGTLRDNRTSSWSVNAIQDRTGMAFERGKEALRKLQEGELVRQTRGGTRPQYELIGCLNSPTEEGSHFAVPIWLPNTFVDGTARGEDSPVRRLRRSGNIWTLRLAVDLYHGHNLRDDGGISPKYLRGVWDRKNLAEQNNWRVWAFKYTHLELFYEGPFESHKDRPRTASGSAAVRDNLLFLEKQGLFRFVPHLWESASEEAEMIHPYGKKWGSPWNDLAKLEHELIVEAELAATVMASPKLVDDAKKDGYSAIVPVRKDYPEVQMVTIAQLTYRPHTRRTAEWLSQLRTHLPEYTERFKSLRAIAERDGQHAEITRRHSAM